MKIVNIEAIKEKINKLDAMAKTDMTKLNSVFPQKEDKSGNACNSGISCAVHNFYHSAVRGVCVSSD